MQSFRPHLARTGWIEVVAGSMYSGKSSELIRRIRRALIAGRKVQIFKSHLDVRYAGTEHVSSHDGRSADAVPIQDSAAIERLVTDDTHVVAIDEAQFLDDGIVDVVNRLADRGHQVIVVGLDMDFRGRPFGPMSALMAVAERVDKLHAICVRCGAEGTRNQRLVGGRPAAATGPTIEVGAEDSYEARCRSCHEVPTEQVSAA